MGKGDLLSETEDWAAGSEDSHLEHLDPADDEGIKMHATKH